VWDGGWGWGTAFLDADHDGWLDLVATNGYYGPWAQDPSRFFEGSGGPLPTFTDASSATAFDDTRWGSALVSLDYDRDGDLDLVQSCAPSGFEPSSLRLLENRRTGTAPHNYLVVQPRMPGPNHWAIGAVVRVEVGALSMARVITAGTSFFGQEPAEAHFGLGAAAAVDRVVVEWPDGTTGEWDDVSANQVLTVQSASPPDSIVLQLAPGPGEADVTLIWTGGQPDFAVFRSSDAFAVTVPANELGQTSGWSWIDGPAEGPRQFYRVQPVD
jgi:hypothetical protein